MPKSKTTTQKKPVKFSRPPVIEVVCGVQFAPLRELKVPYIGTFWTRLRKKFPVIEERPPLTPIIESGGDPSLTLQLVDAPPVPRIWMISEDGKSLLQIQRDRFLYNWKRTSDHDNYPSYEKVIKEFNKSLTLFKQHLERENVGNLDFNQYELAYVNHITSKNGMDILKDEGLLIDHAPRTDMNRFLPTPAAYNWRTVYALPKDMGRLYITAQTANKDGEDIVRLDLTARGMPSDKSEKRRQAWFNLAHEWITHGFADVTIEKLQQEYWGRKQ